MLNVKGAMQVRIPIAAPAIFGEKSVAKDACCGVVVDVFSRKHSWFQGTFIEIKKKGSRFILEARVRRKLSPHKRFGLGSCVASLLCKQGHLLVL